MDSSPFRPKPAIPSYLTDELSPLGVSESLHAQVQNSNQGRQVVDLDGPSGYFPKLSTGAKMDGSNYREKHQVVHGEIDMEGCNEGSLTSTPLPASRAQSSSNTQHAAIDFDDLSWPSR
jgi:GTP cyclohydrolase I